jgi:predicted nucleic acid-binding protein
MQGLSDPILVDSAIYIDRLRAGHDIRQELMPWLANGLLFNCGIVRGEVIRGFKNARLKAEMNAFFNIVPEVPTTARMWQQIAELAWSLDRATGDHRPLTDIIIARCAMQIGAVLISPDRHFEAIPGLKLRNALNAE